MSVANESSVKAAKELTAGVFAGSVGVVSGFPFDTVKVRLQAERGVYRGAWHCFTHILKFDGLRGLYRGLTPPLIGGAMETGINYLVYHRVLSIVGQGSTSLHPPIHHVPFAAGMAGAALSVVLGPTELIKCRMQVAGGKKYSGPIHCLQVLIQREGYWGLTRGFGATVGREVPGNAIFFTSYECLRRAFPGRPRTEEEKKNRSFLGLIADATSAVLCGGAAGTLMWAMVLPVDVAKTRLQTAFPGEKYDVGIMKQLRMLWMEGRWRALYAGWSPTLLRAFPANACQWLAWEIAIDQLKH